MRALCPAEMAASPDGERFITQVKQIQNLHSLDPRAGLADPRLPSSQEQAAREASSLDAGWKLKFEGWRLGWLIPSATALGACAHTYLGEPSVHTPLCRLLRVLTHVITKTLVKESQGGDHNLSESRMLGDMTQVLLAAVDARLNLASNLDLLCSVALRRIGRLEVGGATPPESRTQALAEAAHALALAGGGTCGSGTRCLIALSDASAPLLQAFSCDSLAQLLGSLAMADAKVPPTFLSACHGRMHELLAAALAADGAAGEAAGGGTAGSATSSRGGAPFSSLSRQTLAHIHAWQVWCEHELMKGSATVAQGYGAGAEPLLLPMWIRKRCVDRLLGGPLAVRSALERSVSDALHSLGGMRAPRRAPIRCHDRMP